MDLAKDPGCDGAWGKGVRLVVNDCLNRFWLLARAVEDNGSTLKSLGIGLASESLLIDFARRREYYGVDLAKDPGCSLMVSQRRRETDRSIRRVL